MANIATLLKREITRLVRKELKTETESIKKANSRYRSEIAELKRRIATLERQQKAAEKQGRRQEDIPSAPSGTKAQFRFRPAGLKTHRERLGLSASMLASILGVSAQTIYNWEASTSAPNKDQIAKIAILRKMGKREVQARLAAMEAAKSEVN
ncbi:MAG: XRE family transcriptional regulator [Deltaproteobacteria bacterium]|nr:XRE family transcriptional regulator [Deltaproteobacteria bacterium]